PMEFIRLIVVRVRLFPPGDDDIEAAHTHQGTAVFITTLKRILNGVINLHYEVHELHAFTFRGISCLEGNTKDFAVNPAPVIGFVRHPELLIVLAGENRPNVLWD